MTIEEQLRAKHDALVALQSKIQQGNAERARMGNRAMNLRREIETLNAERDGAAQKTNNANIGGAQYDEAGQLAADARR